MAEILDAVLEDGQQARSLAARPRLSPAAGSRSGCPRGRAGRDRRRLLPPGRTLEGLLVGGAVVHGEGLRLVQVGGPG